MLVKDIMNFILHIRDILMNMSQDILFISLQVYSVILLDWLYERIHITIILPIQRTVILSVLIMFSTLCKNCNHCVTSMFSGPYEKRLGELSKYPSKHVVGQKTFT